MTDRPRLLWSGPLGATILGWAAVLPLMLSCSRTSTPPAADVHTASGDPSVSPREPLKLPSTPFANALRGEYVGSQVCGECHSTEMNSYLATRHSRSAAPVSGTSIPMEGFVEHAASRRTYRITHEEARLWHEETLHLPGGKELSTGRHAQDLVVGSGEFGHSYAFHDGDFLVQSPLTWYSPRAEWDMSPGFDDPQHLSFRRAISTGCLFCHSGIVREMQGNPYHPEIVEYAIGCERCHGPGSLHVARHSESGVSAEGEESTIDRTIVNPAHLSRDLAEDVCQQCHLQSDAHVNVRRRDQSDYRPGLPLSHFRLELRDRHKSEMTIVGHAEQLHLSRCFRESDQLRCTSCHDPHHPIEKAERVAYYRQACLTCHSVEHCPEAIEPDLRGTDLDCTSCHMPKSATEVPHVAFTHHRIGIHHENDAVNGTGESDESRTDVVPVQDLAGLPMEEVDRCRGLGAWQLYQLRPESSQRIDLGRAAEKLLIAAWESGIRDPETAAALAGIAQEVGDDGQAQAFAQWVLQQEPSPTDAHVAALEIVAQQNFRRKNFSAARQQYQRLAQIRREARSWFFLGLCAQNLSDSTAAIAALERSLEINPTQSGAHQALAAIHHALGNFDESTRHKTLAAALREPQ